MDALDARAVDEDLDQRLGRRQVGHFAAGDLEGDPGSRSCSRPGLPVSGAAAVSAPLQENARMRSWSSIITVSSAAASCPQSHRRAACARSDAASPGRVEARHEEIGHSAGDRRIGAECALHVVLAEGDAGLPDTRRRRANRDPRARPVLPAPAGSARRFPGAPMVCRSLDEARSDGGSGSPVCRWSRRSAPAAPTASAPAPAARTTLRSARTPFSTEQQDVRAERDTLSGGAAPGEAGARASRSRSSTRRTTGRRGMPAADRVGHCLGCIGSTR